MAPETHRDLAEQLSGLLREIDVAIRGGVRESAAQTASLFTRTSRRDTGVRGTLLAALRRLAGPAVSRRAS